MKTTARQVVIGTWLRGHSWATVGANVFCAAFGDDPGTTSVVPTPSGLQVSTFPSSVRTKGDSPASQSLLPKQSVKMRRGNLQDKRHFLFLIGHFLPCYTYVSLGSV